MSATWLTLGPSTRRTSAKAACDQLGTQLRAVSLPSTSDRLEVVRGFRAGCRPLGSGTRHTAAKAEARSTCAGSAAGQGRQMRRRGDREDERAMKKHSEEIKPATEKRRIRNRGTHFPLSFGMRAGRLVTGLPACSPATTTASPLALVLAQTHRAKSSIRGYYAGAHRSVVAGLVDDVAWQMSRDGVILIDGLLHRSHAPAARQNVIFL